VEERILAQQDQQAGADWTPLLCYGAGGAAAADQEN